MKHTKIIIIIQNSEIYAVPEVTFLLLQWKFQFHMLISGLSDVFVNAVASWY